MLLDVGVTHVVTVPDSTIGAWGDAIEDSHGLKLIRVCREGEAWPLAAGIMLGGERVIVIMQSTGFFESGDALRNVVYDLQVPVFAIVGARNWLTPNSPDSARRFVEPLVKAWQISYVTIENPSQKHLLEEHYRSCEQSRTAGVVLVAEGQG